MSEEETVEGEAIEEAEYEEDLLPAVVEEKQAITLFGTNDPVEIVEKATAIANALSGVIREKKLFSTISGRQHVKLEGWTLCGTMLGVFGDVVWSREVHDGWEARAEARTLSGALVGSAEAQCTRSESTWAKRDDFAIRSMAQTRALSKALRMPLGFIVTLAGYDTTPAEEMTMQAREERALKKVESNPYVTSETSKALTAAIKLAGAYDKDWTPAGVKARCISMGWLKEGQSAKHLTETQALEIIAGAEDTVRAATAETHPEGEPAEVVPINGEEAS